MIDAKAMYCNMVEGPCAAALFDKEELLTHYGRYDTRWWQSKLCNSATTEQKHKGWKENVRCERCGRACERWANYCAKCGVRLRWGNYCAECGTRLRTKTSSAKASVKAPTDSAADVDMEADRDASERDNHDQR